ncbi:MAG: DUF4920 domain-containing protein [Crocinitomicaceae bacterium]|nr:DUF4920 domain-containing protein [Crocinitomicaceae bacterium]
MKKIIILALVLTACKSASYFGDKISSENLVSYKDAKAQSFEKGSIETKIEGTILETCPKKGCWMKMDMGSDTVLVRFKDYSFFVPTEGAEGKSAVIQGNLFVDTISVDMQRHYAEDAGKSKAEIEKITEPKLGLSFLANGVIINK